MVQRPSSLGGIEFAVLSSLRAAQLVRGCIPQVDPGTHKKTTTAQMEVAQMKIQRAPDGPIVADDPTRELEAIFRN